MTFYDLIEREPIKQIIIGPAFARATRAVAELSTRFCIPQVSRIHIVTFRIFIKKTGHP